MKNDHSVRGGRMQAIALPLTAIILGLMAIEMLVGR